MKRFKKMVLVGTSVAIIGVMAFPAFAYADDGSGATGPWNFFERFHNKVADILGITANECRDTANQAREEVLADGADEGWLTENQVENMQERSGKRREMKLPDRIPGFGFDAISVFAETLDMEKSDLLSELEDGKTISQVAQEKGVDTSTLIDAYIDELTQNLEEAVSDEAITQKYADSILAEAEENAENILNNNFTKGSGRRGFLK